MKKVKKHLGILGRKPSARLYKNTERLYCLNCKEIPLYTLKTDWYYQEEYGETCLWFACNKCHTPLKRID